MVGKDKGKFSVDFIGIGVEKAGTTWLADCLRRHENIYIPEIKEIFFFNDYDPHFLTVKNLRYMRGIDWYKRQFINHRDKRVGEFSPTYLYSAVTAQRIKKHFPETKIIVVLRDPVLRAFSQFVHDKRLGVIKEETFENALEKYDNYFEKGLYYKHLIPYLKLFDRDNILVLLLDDINKNPQKVLRQTYQFLGLKNISFKPPNLNKKVNRARQARLHFLNHFMIQSEYFLRQKNLDLVRNLLEKTGLRNMALKLRDINSKPLKNYPKLKKETSEKLRKLYLKDITKLEKLIGRNLGNWK